MNAYDLLTDRHRELIAAVNNAVTVAEHDRAEAYLRGWRDGAAVSAVVTIDQRLRTQAKIEWEASVADAFRRLSAELRIDGLDVTQTLESTNGFTIRPGAASDVKSVVTASPASLLWVLRRAVSSAGIERAGEEKIAQFLKRVDTLASQVEDLRGWAQSPESEQ